MRDFMALQKLMISPMATAFDPRHRNVTEYFVSPEEADVVIYGVPFDAGTQRHVGTNEGPIGVRNALTFFRNYSSDADLCFTDYVKIADIGNVDTVWNAYDFTFKNAAEVQKIIIEAGKVPIVIGGDHSVTYRNIKSFMEMYPEKKMGLVWLDNHLDAMEDFHGDDLHCGTPLWHIMKEYPNRIDPKNVVHMGSRGFQLGEKGWANQKELGFQMIKAQEIKLKGIQAAVKKAISMAHDGTDMVYMTLDIDIAEGIYAPGTQCNNPGGLNSFELLYLIREVAKTGIVGFDVMEVAPRADVADVTIQLGACAILEFLTGMAWKKRAEQE